MARFTPRNITSGYPSLASLIAQLQEIEEAIGDTLSRVGDSPNSMEVNIDMDSHKIINLPAPTTDTEPVRLGDLEDAIGELTDLIANPMTENLNAAGFRIMNLPAPAAASDAVRLQDLDLISVGEGVLPALVANGLLSSPDGATMVFTKTPTGLESLTVDNVNVNGNVISTTNANGDLTLTPNGTGTVVVSTDLDVDNINVNGNTIISTDTNGDINIDPNGTGSVSIPAPVIGVTTLTVDNINVNGNTIISTDTNGNINLTPNGTGSVVISKSTLSDATITGGSVAGITDLAIADGGTGASTAATARSNLGVKLELLADSEIASTTPTVEFTSLNLQLYSKVIVVLLDVSPLTDNVSLRMRFSHDNGVSYDSDAGRYRHSRMTVVEAGTVSGTGSASDTSITLVSGQGNVLGTESFSGEFSMNVYTIPTYVKCWWEGVYAGTTSISTRVSGAGRYTRDAYPPMQAIRFYYSSGNFNGGRITVYGVKV